MTTREAFLTHLFNTYLAGLGNWLLALFGRKTSDEPWADHMVMQLLVALIMVVLFLVLRSQLSVDKPGKLQQIFEMIHTFVIEQADDQIEHHQGRHHVVLLRLGEFHGIRILRALARGTQRRDDLFRQERLG